MRAWQAELEALRPGPLGAGLDEEFKWPKPHGGSNVVIFQPFKELCARERGLGRKLGAAS